MPQDGIIGDYNGFYKTFTSDDQLQILHRVQSAYFLSIVIIQAFHIFQIRARTSSILQRGIFGNWRLVFGVIIANCIALAVVFLHVVQLDFLNTENPPVDAITFGCIVAVILIYAYNEWRKWWILKQECQRIETEIRNHPNVLLKTGKFSDSTNKNHRAALNTGHSLKSMWELLMKW